MRIIPFVISALVTAGLVFILSIQIPVGPAKTPPLGSFLSPHHGFWQNAEPLDEDFNAQFTFPELKGKVEVYLDDRLVPHIYAEQDNDAYFVQGFLHAKFRLWQMDFQTYAAGGRLSEILGDSSGTTNFLKIDRFFRRLGMVYGAEQSLKALEADPITKSASDAYTSGVNAYIKSLPGNQLPLEYKLLDYKPEPWTNLKTALFLKYMSYDLTGGDDDFELTNARSIFSSLDFEKIYPLFSDSLDPIVPRGTKFQAPSVVVTPPSSVDSLYFGYKNEYPSMLMKPDKDNGSNNWAVAGSKTRSGAPILCNDPHLGLNLPSLWYEMQITTPTHSVYGVSFPGAPSIVIGFNDSCAWGVTNAGRDVKDYYEVQFRDSSMQEYWYDHSWKKATMRQEVIKVRGKPDVIEKIAMTDLGHVMFDQQYPNRLIDGKYYALRWKALEPSNELMTFYKLNRAKNFGDYLDAISTYQCPGQNFIFASKTGTIAIKQQGAFPAKWQRQGDFVMPGTDATYAWNANIPFDENPMMVNPERGFVSSANQQPADNTYPYYLGGSFPPYRGFIINRRLRQMSDITPEDMQGLQTDNYNVFAEMARPVLLNNIDEAKLTPDEKNILSKLKDWNLRNDIGEQGITIFNSIWDSLEAVVWADEFSQSSLPLKWPDESTLLEGLLKDSSFKFVDDIRTQAVETLPEMMMKAFKLAYQSLKQIEGKEGLAWGKYKNTGVRHLLRIPALGRLGLPIGGGAHIINATKQYHGPSWRMIVSLTAETEAYVVYPGGQSGNVGSRYYDTFVDSWASGKYYNVKLWDKEAARRSVKWIMSFSNS
jgi:penicillin G amidase